LLNARRLLWAFGTAYSRFSTAVSFTSGVSMVLAGAERSNTARSDFSFSATFSKNSILALIWSARSISEIGFALAFGGGRLFRIHRSLNLRGDVRQFVEQCLDLVHGSDLLVRCVA
jgi:hypothetical protein